jgi:CubicO group peptidase (beta-lactamase class C family)
VTKTAAADSWTLEEWADGSDVSIPVPSGIVFPGASWATDTPANQGLDATATTAFVSAISSGNTGDEGGLMIRNGYQVASWGVTTTRIDMASATKPITAMMLAFAIADGLPIADPVLSPDDLVSKFGWSMIAKDAAMTLAHLASMKSGYMLQEEPGHAYAYNDYGIMLLAKTIFDEIFAGTPNTIVLSYLSALGFEDGDVYGSYSLNTSQRDLARIGWMLCQKGQWNTSQIVPREFLEDWYRPQVPGTLPRTSGISNGESPVDYLGVGSFGGTENSGTPVSGIYGFGMWYNGLLNGTTRLFPSAPENFRFAEGHSDKFMLLWPDEQIVVCAKSANWGSLTADAGVASSTMDDMMALIAATVP